MTGAILNAAGIFIGGIIGMSRTTPLAPQSQAFFKLALGVFTIFFGLRLTVMSVSGTFGQVVKQIFIALLAIMLGKLLGHLLGFQKASNHLGQHARYLMESTKPEDPHRFSNGMNACAILFCASPLGILGAVHDGLFISPDGTGYFYPLLLKGVMDGLAMLGFVVLFGGGSMLAALPVFVFQSAISLACSNYLGPFLREHALLDSVNIAGGLVMCTIGLVIFEIKKVELADYLPSLALAPLLTWIFGKVL